MSERELNMLYLKLTTTFSALATTGLMMCKLLIGHYSCYEGINPVIRYTDDYSLATTGLISIIRGAPDSIMNVNNPESVDANDDFITDELPIVQSSSNGLSKSESDNISTPRPSFYAIFKQCWTVNDPSREKIFYEWLEGECQKNASHTGENNNRVTRAMLSSAIRCYTNFGNLNTDQKQFPDSQSIYSNMYSIILTAQGEASTPVAEGTSPRA